MSETPFIGKTVKIHDRLTDRLRGKYAVGPIAADGEPEFGWSQHPSPPIQIEAAAVIEQLLAALSWSLEYLQGYDHIGTGSQPPAKEMRDYEEKLETIRLMVGQPRETKMKLGEHFLALTTGEQPK